MAVEVEDKAGVGQRDGSRTAPAFDHDNLAHLEIAGWRAYYDRAWPRMLWLLVKMEREQFGLPWHRAIQGAYYVVRASAAWVPLDHDLRKVLLYLHKFYKLVVRHGSGFRFDPRKVAELELKYWHYNRQLAHSDYDENNALVRSLAELHSATFMLPINAVWESAKGRGRSLHMVGRITGKRSTDLEGDWQRAEEYLREGYRSLTARLH